MLPRVIIITGPTASGKTALSESLAQTFNGTIINADVGQFYTSLTIGTAKPDWKNKPFECLLFDILDQPVELNVVTYRKKVLQAVTSVISQDKLPIIVGGSLFYIKSLFFPPLQSVVSENCNEVDLTQPTETLWNTLKTIDADRAAQLHCNDRYRIVRALTLWQQTGKKPSQQLPVYAPVFHALVITLEPPRDVLKERIKQRTFDMFQQGLIEEVRQLVNTDWEAFLVKKGIIGCDDIFRWVHAGQQPSTLEMVKTLVNQKTWQYAKRQLVFLSKFKEELMREGRLSSDAVQALTILHGDDAPRVENSVRKFIKNGSIE